MKYFEVLFGNDDGRGEWIAFKGKRVPNVDEASVFYREEAEKIGKRVTGVYELSEREVMDFYDCSNMSNWKVFG